MHVEAFIRGGHGVISRIGGDDVVFFDITRGDRDLIGFRILDLPVFGIELIDISRIIGWDKVLHTPELEVADFEVAIPLTLSVNDRAIAEIIEHKGKFVSLLAIPSEGHDGFLVDREFVMGFQTGILQRDPR